MGRPYIFESLLGAPPVTFATLRAPSSCLSSFSWAWSSDLLFSRSSCALSLAAQSRTGTSGIDYAVSLTQMQAIYDVQHTHLMQH